MHIHVKIQLSSDRNIDYGLLPLVGFNIEATLSEVVTQAYLTQDLTHPWNVLTPHSPTDSAQKNLKELNGGSYRIRTYDQLVKSQLLYRLS